MVASSTRITPCGADESSFFNTRTILASSAIRSDLFCSRPAVSISSTSMPSGAGAFERLEGDAGRVGADLLGDDLRADARRPTL